jgi:hypothetical protein
MNRTFSTLILAALILAVSAADVKAADTVAASCSAADIQTAIDSSVSTGGGTVHIPACDYTNSWSGTDKIYKDVGSTELRIIGQGISNTKIGYADNVTMTGSMWEIKGTGFKEMAYMYLEGNNDNSAYKIGNSIFIRDAVNARIHHIETKYFYARSHICHTSNLLIDHCIFNQVLDANQYHFDIYDRADVDWGSDGITFPSAFGSNNFNVFFEDNTFYGAHHPVSTFVRAKVVFRYNTVIIPEVPYSGDNQGNLDAHEPGYGCCPGDGIPDASSYYHGGQAYEIYNNTFTRVGNQIGRGYAIRLRSGAAIITNNVIENQNIGIEIRLDSGSLGGLCNAANNYLQDHSIALNNKPACRDTDGCCDKPEYMYIWNNTFVNDPTNISISSGAPGGGGLTEEQEYFLRAPSQNSDSFTWTPYPYPHPLQGGTLSQNCSELGGSCCQSGQTCTGSFQSSSDCSSLCCVGGSCQASCIHRSDLPPCDGCISDAELTAFIGQWYLDSSNPTLRELMEAIGLWKRGGC